MQSGQKKGRDSRVFLSRYAAVQSRTSGEARRQGLLIGLELNAVGRRVRNELVTRFRVGLACVIIVTGLLQHVQTQSLVINSQMRHSRGQQVVPFYEGWYQGSDGLIRASFGYVNLNLDEILDIPVGPDNVVMPGPVDQGQPTHFLPGHQKGVFVVTLRKDRSTTEITWTLSIRGKTMSVPSNLGSLYQIEGLVSHGGSSPGNTPPVLKFIPKGTAGQGPKGLTMDATVETTVRREVSFDVWITDDGLPTESRPLVIRSLQGAQRRRPRRGLSVTWSKYRGPGVVRFSDLSPSIKGSSATTSATFMESGEYMLRVLVSDGSGFNGCCWTNGYVRVFVK